MQLNFNSIFHPEIEFENIKLTDLNPCRKCKVYKDYEERATYGTIAERQYACLPDSCRVCKDKLLWEIQCMDKLKWYEDNDQKLKKKRRGEKHGKDSS